MIYRKWQVLALGLGLMLAACSPDEIPPIGEEFDKVSPMIGDWTLTSITQTDEIALANDEQFSSQDLTAYFDFTEYQLSLSSDNSFLFTSGAAPDYIGKASGSWMLDNNDAPSYLYLIDAGMDTLKLPLDRITLPNSDQLEFSIKREDAGEVYLSYQFVFEK